MQSINCCLLKEGKGEGRPTDGRGTKGHTQNGKRRRRRARSYKKGKEIAKHMKRRHLVGEFWNSFRDVTFFRLSCEECSNQGKEEKRGPFLVFEDGLKGTQKKRGDYGYRYHMFFPSLGVSSFRENLLVAKEEAKNGNCTVSGLLLPSASVGFIKGFT